MAGGAAHLSEDSPRRGASCAGRGPPVRGPQELRAPPTAHPRPSGAGEEIRAGAFPVRLPALLALAGRVGDREALARGIVAKRLHDPIVRLKELSGNAPNEAPDRDPPLVGRKTTPTA